MAITLLTLNRSGCLSVYSFYSALPRIVQRWCIPVQPCEAQVRCQEPPGTARNRQQPLSSPQLSRVLSGQAGQEQAKSGSRANAWTVSRGVCGIHSAESNGEMTLWRNAATSCESKSCSSSRTHYGQVVSVAALVCECECGDILPWMTHSLTILRVPRTPEDNSREVQSHQTLSYSHTLISMILSYLWTLVDLHNLQNIIAYNKWNRHCSFCAPASSWPANQVSIYCLCLWCSVSSVAKPLHNLQSIVPPTFHCLLLYIALPFFVLDYNIHQLHR